MSENIQSISINGKNHEIIRLLGKGKGGYSYLAKRDNKEYIPGPTAAELVEHHQMRQSYVEQIEKMCERFYPNHTNIDYYPTNFVLFNEKLYYIDYECNEYMEEWNFENWGKQYWPVEAS